MPSARTLASALVLALLSAAFLPVPPAGAAVGALVGEVTVPVPAGSGIGVSIAFDGTTFYYTNYGEPTLYGYTVSCAGTACAPTLTLANPITLGEGGPAVEVDAMAWDGNRGLLWAAGLDDSVIYRINVTTGVAQAVFTIGACNPFGLVDGLAYDGLDDVLYFSADGSFSVCKYSLSGSLLASIPVTSIVGFPSGCYNSGLAVGGDYLYLGTNGCGQIVRVDKTTLSGAVLFASPGGRDEDMECDPLTFAPRSVIWSKDAYNDVATAFEVEGGTCGVGGLPACTAAPLAVSITRPAAHTRYVHDAPLPHGSAVPLVLGDLTVQASAADPTRVAGVEWRVDGAPFAAGGPAPDYQALWPAGAAAPGPHALTALFRDAAEPGCVHRAATLVHVARFAPEALARAVFVSTTHPVETTVTSPGADGVAGPPQHRFLDHETPEVGLRVGALHDEASTRDGGAGSHATSVLTEVSLLGGRIRAEILRAEADASADAATLAVSTSAEGSLVAGLTVDGTPVPVTAPNTRVDVPGVGRLVLLETVESVEGSHAELRVNALHLYADVEGLRAEVVLGQAIAGVDLESAPFGGRWQEIHAENDAGTGGDVGDAPADAHPLDLGTGTDLGATLLGGRLWAQDKADWYSLRLVEGEKVEILVKPAEAVEAQTGVATVPPTMAALTLQRADVDTDLEVVLRAPSGKTLRSALPLTLHERIELNADEDGTWAIGILGNGESTNYTLSAAVTPLAFLPDAAAGLACGDPAAPLLRHDAPFADRLLSHDASQWLRVRAAFGDDLSVTLHPLDADGADFDLFLYDRGCRLVASSTLGKPLLWDGDAPKGLPDAVAQLPTLQAGDYWVEARRIVGVGSYLLVGQSNTVIPTLPGNDAGTGADASDDTAAPTPLPGPGGQGAYEGRLDEGDPRDVYSFPVKAGERALVTWIPSPANVGRLSVIGPSGGHVPVERGVDAFSRGTLLLTAPAAADATYRIVVEPLVGGGNYVLTVAHG